MPLWLIRYWPHALIVVCLAAIAWVIAHAAYNWGYDTANVRAEKVIGDFAKAEAEAQENARAVEQRRMEDLAALDAKYQRELDDAKARAESVAADLRAGNRSLRREIAAYATERLSGHATSTGELSEAAQRGAALVGEAIGIGRECDATQRALIEAYEAQRRPAL